MTEFWDKQIYRAEQLAGQSSGSRELLTFYAHLLRAQNEIYENFRCRKDWLPSGDLQKDLQAINNTFYGLLKTVASHGPATLSGEAQNLLDDGAEAINEMLSSYWRSPSDLKFFPKAILQPYTRWLIESGAKPVGR